MTVDPAEVAAAPLFRGVPFKEISWLAAASEEKRFAEGEVAFAFGARAEHLFVLLEGAFNLVVKEGGQEVASLTMPAGEVGGRLPFSRMEAWVGQMVAERPSRAALFPSSRFQDLRVHAPTVEERLVHQMLDRARDGTRLNVNREKLAALGTMAAGLAHELNNPASAARRTAQELAATLQAFDELSSRILRQVMFRELPEDEASGEHDPFAPVYERMTLKSPAKDALEQGELEDDLSDWLEEHGVAEPWVAAPTLVSGGFTREFLEEFSRKLLPDQVRNFLEWVPKDVEMRLLSQELVESTRRMAELVGAMKEYSFMDQGAAKTEIDLHRGIDATLRVLKYKLRKKNVRVVRRYGDLPRVCAFGSELNQVWTNLIDNAVAAVDEGGTITIVSSLDEASGVACIDVIDDGGGIPEEIQDRIFEPFFTTRPVGEGTGLGLDISHRIVTRHHGGSLQVESEPGHTRFRVRIPVK